MANTANVVFVIGYAQNNYALAKNKVLTNKYSEKRAFYSCNKLDIDYLKYVEKGSKEPVPYVKDYVGYSDDEDKSKGIFDKNGLMNRKEKAELRKQLRSTESIIWHGIISFDEVFGKRYMANYDEAYRLMKTEFPRFLKSAGFDPDKIEWFAGLHENTRYRHIHYSFFEKEPSRFTAHRKGFNFVKKGQINQFAIEQFKIRVEQRLTDLSSEIKIARKELLDITKNLLFSPQSKIRYRQDMQERLDRLMTELPPDGKLGYDSENMKHMKPQVNKIIDALIKTNKPAYNAFIDFSRQVNRKDAETLTMLKASKIKESEWYKYLTADKTLKDLYCRLGNQIITKVRSIKKSEKLTKNRLANKRIRRRTLASLVVYSMELNTDFQRDAMEAFEEFLHKLDEEKEKTLTEIQYEME